MSPTTAAPFAGNKPTLPERCPLHAPGNRHRTERKLLTTLPQRPGARGGGGQNNQTKTNKRDFFNAFLTSQVHWKAARPARRSASPFGAPSAGLRASGAHPRDTHTPRAGTGARSRMGRPPATEPPGPQHRRTEWRKARTRSPRSPADSAGTAPRAATPSRPC